MDPRTPPRPRPRIHELAVRGALVRTVSGDQPRATSVEVARISTLVGTVALLSLAACGPRLSANANPNVNANDVPRTCATALTPLTSVAALSPAIDTTTRPSKVVVAAEIPFARIAAELEKSVPRRVAEEHGRDIGIAGSLDTTVDRGPFSVSVSPTGDALVVKTTLHAQARACTTSRGCYATCSPEAVAVTTVPLALGETYAIGAPRLAVTLVRGCRVSALGGLVSLDLTPTIQAELGPHVRRVEKEIVQRLPNVRSDLVVRWAELARAHELPLGAGCVTLHPSGLAQGPSSTNATGDAVRLRFTLTASPELRPRCDEGPPLLPNLLPPLVQDAGMPEEDELDVRVRMPLTALGNAASAPRAMTLGSALAVPKAATVRADGAGVAVEVALEGEVCGTVRAKSTVGWKDDARALGFTSTAFSADERARLSRAVVAPEAFVTALEANVRVTPKLTPETLKTALPALLSAVSSPDVELSAEVSSTRPGEVRTDGEDVVASTKARGKLRARLSR